MAIKKFGSWKVEYPASVNGNAPSYYIAFVSGKYASGFVSLYALDSIGIDSAINPPESVKKYLYGLTHSVRFQWEELINSGRIPVMEYQISESEYLVCDISLSDDNECFFFSFDKDPLHDVYFSGDVTTFSSIYYRYPVDNEMSLDWHLDAINQEMMEGYLLPNNLYYCED